MSKIEMMKKLIEENPKSAYSWYLLGIECALNKDISQALNAFSESLKYSDTELKNKIMLAISHLPPIDTDCIKQTTTGTEDLIEDTSLSVISGGKNTENIILFKKDQINFNDVGGLENLKDIIRMKIIKPFTNPELFNKFKKRVGGGILLYGPPGCGKTYIARATAGECNAEFLPVHITDILSKYIGESEQNVADIFSTARSKKPCVLFFDELDTMGYNRSRLSSEHMRSVIDHLLTEMEGVNTSTDQLLIIGATNMPWDIDTAFKRPGRFDKMVFVHPPDNKAREIIFQLKLSGKPIENINYELLAKNTELYSGADIENIVEIASENVITEIMKTGIERNITMKDLICAINSTKSSTIEWLRTIKNYVKYANQTGIYDDVSDYLNSNKKFI